MKKLLYSLLFISIISWGEILAQSTIWNTYGSMAYPVAGGQATIWQNNIYISGGYSDSVQGYVNWVQKYDFLQNSTEIIAHMEKRRYGHESAYYEGKIYFIGGVHDTTEFNTSIESWDVSGVNPSLVFDYEGNFNRIFPTGVIHYNSYYLFGGNSYLWNDTSKMSYIIEYNFNSNEITFTLDDESYGEIFPEQQMSEIFGDDIFFFGGVINGVSQNIYKFNTVSHELEKLSIQLMEPRAGGVAVRYIDAAEIYIIGGFNESNTALSSTEIFKINGANYTIESGPYLNVARKELMAAFTGNSIIAFGGKDVNGNVVPEIEVLETTVTNNEDTKIAAPLRFELEQNYPNPFNPVTTVKYAVNKSGKVTLKVYDTIGSEIKSLVDENKSSGSYSAQFDASELSSGVYFYQLRSGTDFKTRKMVLLK